MSTITEQVNKVQQEHYKLCKQVKTRTPHSCNHCNTHIPTGTCVMTYKIEAGTTTINCGWGQYPTQYDKTIYFCTTCAPVTEVQP